MRILVAVLALLVAPVCAQAQASASLRVQARVVDAQPGWVALAAARAARTDRIGERATAGGLAVIVEHWAGDPVDRPRRPAVVEISFLRN
jgi:hypothetical protein